MNKIGISTSVSALYDYNINDTLDYFNKHPQFESIQIYLTEKLLNDENNVQELKKRLGRLNGVPIYFHVEGELNESLLSKKRYLDALANISRDIQNLGIIVHFDHHPELMEYTDLLNELQEIIHTPLLIEIFFTPDNSVSYQQQLNKYQSLFSLFYKQFQIKPVIDIPRFYHENNHVSLEEATHDLKLTLNLMKSKNLAVLLHVIDISHPRQSRSDFCTIGTGIIPYKSIFEYITYNKITIEGVILEYEDKIKPLESIKYFENVM